MVSKEDRWVRIFDIPNVSQHKKGFTLYKVISMLYPESCPDAITKITVWKRYNDFKKLHREMKSLHRSLKIKDKFPSLPSATFFNRFDDEIIQQRKQMILNFLEYISAHSHLFTSNSFVKFFETSHTPCALLSSSINSIRADLNLPSEPEYLSFHSPDSDDDCTMSDTDSVSTMSSLSSSIHVTENDSFLKTSNSFTGISRKLSELSLNSSTATRSNCDTISECMSNNIMSGLLKDLEEEQEDDFVSITMQSSNKSPQYLAEAEKYIDLGEKFEQDKSYQEAFTSYKQAIAILLDNVKGDTDTERKHSVRYKVEKYLLRAEKIFNLYLSSESIFLEEKVVQTQRQEEKSISRPLSDLYKFKVIKIIGTGMLVIHSESQQLFYVKVIHKTSIFSSQELVLPTDVPFMMRLHNYYNCENTIFLVLEYCSGLKLRDYVQQTTAIRELDQTPNTGVVEVSDNDSEISFSELLNDFNSNASLLRHNKKVTSTNEKEKVEDVGDMLLKSQELLVSVDEALRKNAELKKEQHVTDGYENDDDFEFINVPSQRKYSDASCMDDCEIEQLNEIPVEKVIRWAAQLLLALEKLHISGVICSDLHSNNILINDKGDLVLTYMCNVNRRKVYNYKVNVSLAPEVYMFEQVTSAADWWSYGTILYEMLVGTPIGCIHPEGILSYTMLKIPKFVSAEGRSLLKQLLIYDPNMRLGSGVNGTEEIKSHPFFSTIKWSAISTQSAE